LRAKPLCRYPCAEMRPQPAHRGGFCILSRFSPSRMPRAVVLPLEPSRPWNVQRLPDRHRILSQSPGSALLASGFVGPFRRHPRPARCRLCRLAAHSRQRLGKSCRLGQVLFGSGIFGRRFRDDFRASRFSFLRWVLRSGGTGARLPFRWPGEETGKILLFTMPPCPVDATCSKIWNATRREWLPTLWYRSAMSAA